MNLAESQTHNWPGERQARFWQQVGCVSEYVYFIQGMSDTPIKIGYTTDVFNRLDTLQTGNPSRLNLLVVLPGSRRLEVAYHRLLTKDRVRGEWFEGVVVDEALEDALECAETMIRIWDERQWLADPFKHLAMVTAPERYNPGSHRRQIELVGRPKPKLPASTRRQRVTGDFNARGLRRSWPMSQRKAEPLTVRFVDPETMDREPSWLRSHER